MTVKIFGRKPSELRHTSVTVISALLVLLIAVPVAHLPAAIVGGVAGATAGLALVLKYLTDPSVAQVIDSADNG